MDTYDDGDNEDEDDDDGSGEGGGDLKKFSFRSVSRIDLN